MPTTLTVTDCPCTLSTTGNAIGSSLVTAATEGSNTVSSGHTEVAGNNPGEHGSYSSSSNPPQTESNHGGQGGALFGTSGSKLSSSHPITTIVPSFTTFFSSPTTFSTNGRIWTVSKPTVLTIDNCPCTITSSAELHSDQTSYDTSFPGPSPTRTVASLKTQGKPSMDTITTTVSIPCTKESCREVFYTTECFWTIPPISQGECSVVKTSTTVLSISGMSTSLVDTFTVPCTFNDASTAEGEYTYLTVATPSPPIPSFTSVVVSYFTSYFASPTTFGTNGKTWTITQPTTITISQCPCTLTHSPPEALSASLEATSSPTATESDTETSKPFLQTTIPASPTASSESSETREAPGQSIHPTTGSPLGTIESSQRAPESTAILETTPTEEGRSGTGEQPSATSIGPSAELPTSDTELSLSSESETPALSPSQGTPSVSPTQYQSGCSVVTTFTKEGHVITVTSPGRCIQEECSTVVTSVANGRPETLTLSVACEKGSPSPLNSPGYSPVVPQLQPFSTSSLPAFANAAERVNISPWLVEFIILLVLLFI